MCSSALNAGNFQHGPRTLGWDGDGFSRWFQPHKSHREIIPSHGRKSQVREILGFPDLPRIETWESWEYEGRSMELTFLASFLGLLFHVEANIWVISGSIITKHRVYQWIGLKEQLQENPYFLAQK